MKNFKQTVVKALLPHIIMTEANARPIHGYELIKLIRRKHGVYFGPSTIYPALAELEKQELITGAWDMQNKRPRKVYTITNKGRILLEQTTTTLTFVSKMLIEVKA